MALVFAGVLLGGSVGAPVIAKVVRPTELADSTAQATIHTRTLSCSGIGFTAISSTVESANYGALRGGEGFHTCSLSLPHKATVTRVRFTVYDIALLQEVRNCALVRVALAASPTPTLEVMASVPATGINPYPGIVRLTDTTISKAYVDNTKWGYFLQCEPTYNSGNVGIYGADVTYTISSVNG
jgi:hypothetical protein